MKAKRPASVAPDRLKLLNEEGTAGVLVGTHCAHCGEYFFGDVVFCQNCSAKDLEPVELSKHGTLYSYTIVRVSPPGWPGDVPYVLGQVELPEGPHIISEVVDCPYQELQTGMNLELALVIGGKDVEGSDLVVYKWRRRESG